jgi:hypothetical protein
MLNIPLINLFMFLLLLWGGLHKAVFEKAHSKVKERECNQTVVTPIYNGLKVKTH